MATPTSICWPSSRLRSIWSLPRHLCYTSALPALPWTAHCSLQCLCLQPGTCLVSGQLLPPLNPRCPLACPDAWPLFVLRKDLPLTRPSCMATTATAQTAAGPTGGHPHTLRAPHSDPRIGSLLLESGALKAADLWHSGLMRWAPASWENPRTEVTQAVGTCRDHRGLEAELGPSPRKPGGSAWHPQALVGGQCLSPHRAGIQRPRVLVSRRPPHAQDPEQGAPGWAPGTYTRRPLMLASALPRGAPLAPSTVGTRRSGQACPARE